MPTFEDVRQLISAAREANLDHLELTLPSGRVRFSFRRQPAGNESAPVATPLVVPQEFEENIQLAEWHEKGRLCVVRSPGVGLWFPAVEPGKRVSKGDALGEIRSVGIASVVRSPTAGLTIVNYAVRDQAVQYGQLLTSILRT